MVGVLVEVPVMLTFTYFCNYMEPKLIERVANCATICPTMKVGGWCCPTTSSSSTGGGGEGEGKVVVGGDRVEGSQQGDKMIESGAVVEVCVEDGPTDAQI